MEKVIPEAVIVCYLKTLREKSDTMASENGHGFQLELLKVQMLKVHNICFSNPPTDTIVSFPY